MAIVATDPYRLVSFVAPPGRLDVRLDRQTLWAERWGLIAPILSLIVLSLTVARRPAVAGIRLRS
ncbi:MAG: hypothetical protein ACHQPH_02930 [Reyranellales bacterium]